METTANDLPLPLRDPQLVLLQSQGRKQEAVAMVDEPAPTILYPVAHRQSS